MLNSLAALFFACEQNKNQKYNTGNLSFSQYHLRNALWLASLGYSVFPVSRSKIPFAKFKWREMSTTDQNTIIEYWQKHPQGCVAIDCEKSGIVVVDVDNKPLKDKDGLNVLKNCLIEWGDLADMPVVISPSGGLHIYTIATGDVLTRCFKNCLDIQRAHYVLAPNSINDEDGLYKIYNKFCAVNDLQKLPKNWLDNLTIFKRQVYKGSESKPYQNYKKKVRDIDVTPLFSRCEFLKYCVEEAETLPEYLWFEFGIWCSGINNGDAIFHKYSEPHPEYSFAQSQAKFEHATNYHFNCQRIRNLFEGCKNCKLDKNRR